MSSHNPVTKPSSQGLPDLTRLNRGMSGYSLSDSSLPHPPILLPRLICPSGRHRGAEVTAGTPTPSYPPVLPRPGESKRPGPCLNPLRNTLPTDDSPQPLYKLNVPIQTKDS